MTRSGSRSSSTTSRRAPSIDMSVETMTRLFELKNIAGVKDATANMVRVSQQRHAMGAGLQPAVGRGHDRHSAYMAAGGHGCISVVANVAPRLCCGILMSAWQKGDYATGLKMQDRLMPLHDSLFKEQPASPEPSMALKLLGRIEEKLRLPLMTGDAADRQGDPRRHGACGPDQLSRQGFPSEPRRGNSTC